MVIQQLIESQLFHLTSMLICLGVIVWLFVRHYFHSEKENGVDNRIRTLNTLYISGILTFIVIELLTAICMNNTKHADILSFVSFAATLSSLILSIVAIIFTIVSGNRGESQYQKLDKVSDEVRISLNRFTEKTQSFDNSIDRFQKVADDLSTQIHDIYDKITGIETPIFEMRDQMLTTESPIKDKENKNKSGVAGDSFKAHVSSFITSGSFSGNLALYACVLSKEKECSFTMSQIRDDDDDEAYKFGYIIASSAMGVISVEVTGQRSIKVLQLGYPELKSLLEQALDAFINTADEAIKKSNLERLNKIKSVFM